VNTAKLAIRLSAHGGTWPGFQRPCDTKPFWIQPTPTRRQVDNTTDRFNRLNLAR
jgi:hypothetical protein